MRNCALCSKTTNSLVSALCETCVDVMEEYLAGAYPVGEPGAPIDSDPNSDESADDLELSDDEWPGIQHAVDEVVMEEDPCDMAIADPVPSIPPVLSRQRSSML